MATMAVRTLLIYYLSRSNYKETEMTETFEYIDWVLEYVSYYMGYNNIQVAFRAPGGLDYKESAGIAGDQGLIPKLKIPEEEWHHSSIFA